MSDAEKREKLHQILDLVIDINGFDSRRVSLTGDKPTAFFWFSGHVSSLEVFLYTRGYKRNSKCNVKMEDYIDEENPKLDEMIQKLEEIKEKMCTCIGLEEE